MKYGFIFAIVGMLVLAGGAAVAYQGMNQGSSNQAVDRGLFHEQMEEIVEGGDYAALEALREETGRPLVRWVHSEEDFAEWQERHEMMEAQYGEGPHYELQERKHMGGKGMHGKQDGSGMREGMYNGAGRGQGMGLRDGSCGQ